MLKTPGQLMETVDLSQSTLRHWRESLTPLKGKNGHRPCFSEADFLALMVIKQIASTLEVGITALDPLAVGIWDLCRPLNWPNLAGQVLIVNPSLGRKSLQLMPAKSPAGALGSAIVVQIGELLVQLKPKLKEDSAGSQRPLALPPTAISRRGHQA